MSASREYRYLMARQASLISGSDDTEAAMFLRLDQTGHTPISADRTLRYWRWKGELKGTKFARRVWFLKVELERFLQVKTERD